MLHKIVTATMCLVSSVAIAGSIELSVAESEAYQGYTRLQHQHLQLIERVKDVEVTTNFDRKGYENGKSAVSAELMLAKTWNDSLYTLTRAAITNDDTIFINNALYNEFGLKAPSDAHITQVVKTDENGVFSFVMNHKGWWGFAALIEEGEKELNGKKYPIENGALLWLKAY